MKVFNNNYIYGKNKERTNFIINYSLDNIDKNILIIDLEKDIDKLYPLTNLNTIKTIILNSETNNVLYYLGLLDDIDIVIINGIQNIEDFDEDHKLALYEEIEGLKRNKNLFSLFLGKEENNNFETNKKLKKEKAKKLEKKIFKINKNLDLKNEDIYFIKRRRVKMIGDKSI